MELLLDSVWLGLLSVVAWAVCPGSVMASPCACAVLLQGQLRADWLAPVSLQPSPHVTSVRILIGRPGRAFGLLHSKHSKGHRWQLVLQNEVSEVTRAPPLRHPRGGDCPGVKAGDLALGGMVERG